MTLAKLDYLIKFRYLLDDQGKALVIIGCGTNDINTNVGTDELLMLTGKLETNIANLDRLYPSNHTRAIFMEIIPRPIDFSSSNHVARIYNELLPKAEWYNDLMCRPARSFFH
jgi:hypothetical protein